MHPLQVGTPEPGKYRAVLNSDDPAFGGQGRINSATEHFTHPEGMPGPFAVPCPWQLYPLPQVHLKRTHCMLVNYAWMDLRRRARNELQ